MIFKNAHRVETGTRLLKVFSRKNEGRMSIFLVASISNIFCFFWYEFCVFYWFLQKYARRLNESYVFDHVSYMLKGGQEGFLLPSTPFWSSGVGVVHISGEGPKMLLG